MAHQPNHYLVVSTPLKKYDRQNGFIFPKSVWKFQKIFELPPTRSPKKKISSHHPFPPPFFQSVPGRVWTWAVVAGSSLKGHRPAPTRRDHPAIERSWWRLKGPRFATRFFLGIFCGLVDFAKKKHWLYVCVYIYIYIYFFIQYIYIYIIDFEIHKMHELKGSNLCFAVCRGPNPLWKTLFKMVIFPKYCWWLKSCTSW